MSRQTLPQAATSTASSQVEEKPVQPAAENLSVLERTQEAP